MMENFNSGTGQVEERISDCGQELWDGLIRNKEKRNINKDCVYTHVHLE